MRAIRTIIICILAVGLLAVLWAGVVAQDEETDPGPAAYVQGSVTGFEFLGGEVETHDDDGNRLTLRGMAGTATLVMDDTRLSGDLELTRSIDEFPQQETDRRVELHWGDVTVRNADGSWVGTWKSTYDPSQFPQQVPFILFELTGTGAYDGLSALLGYPGKNLAGGIGGAVFPGPMPPDRASDQ